MWLFSLVSLFVVVVVAECDGEDRVKGEFQISP